MTGHKPWSEIKREVHDSRAHWNDTPCLPPGSSQACNMMSHRMDGCFGGTTFNAHWQCTLPRGHRGNHVACNASTHDIAEWGDTDPYWCERNEEDTKNLLLEIRDKLR